MKKGLKISLIGCGGMLFLLIVFVIAVTLFVNFADFGQAEVIEHAQAFGRTTDNQGCIDEGLRRAQKLETATPGSSEFWAEVSWMPNCLETSAPTTDFCAGVPSISEEFKNSSKGKLYEEEQCRNDKRFQQVDVHCKSVYSSKQKFCWRK